MNDNSLSIETGHDMWRDLKMSYGLEEATGIANRYLDMQMRRCADNEGEMIFCRQLYAAIND